MSAHGKKRKIDTECHVFNKTWTAKYLCTEVKGKAVCLACGVQVAVFKDYNFNRHYVTKHEEKYKNLSDQERATESDALLAKLQNQQGLFTKLCTSRDAAALSADLQHSQRGSSRHPRRSIISFQDAEAQVQLHR
ncbi:hypothetical protein ABVT39_020995 [Epinephelus coioides]